MGNFQRCLKRYVVEAKRKRADEKWTEWTRVDNHDAAVKHANHATELGYLSRIIDKGETTNE